MTQTCPDKALNEPARCTGAASIRPAAPLPFMNEGPRKSAPAAAEVTFDALRKAEYRGAFILAPTSSALNAH